jgi:hypothetical protein
MTVPSRFWVGRMGGGPMEVQKNFAAMRVCWPREMG